MKSLFILAAMLFATQAFASGAASYSCAGADKVSGSSIVFDLNFGDSAPNEGYTDQSIVITKVAGNQLKKPVTLQMFGATAKNACRANKAGEVYLVGTAFEMNPTKEGDIAPYEITFKANCSKTLNYDVTADCFQTY